VNPFHTVTLDNGLVLEMVDQGNRYFGDYHRIKIVVRCVIPLEARFFGGDARHPALLQARTCFGDSVVFERTLERMGVPGAEVAPVRDAMVKGFLDSSRTYLNHPDFVSRYVTRQLQQRGRSVMPFPR